MSLIAYAGKPIQSRTNAPSAPISRKPPVIAPIAATALSVALRQSFGRITPNVVAAAVADYYGMTLETLTGRKWPRKVSNARALGFAVCRDKFGFRLIRIAEAFGVQDAACVHMGAKKHRLRYLTDMDLREDEIAIMKILGMEDRHEPKTARSFNK